MKFIQLAAAALAIATLSAPVLAQSLTQSVQVNVALTSRCEFTTPALTFTQTYTAFQSGNVTASQNAALRCTRGATAPVLTWDTTTAGVPAVGVVQGLTYQLTAALGTIAAGTAPSGTDVTDIGTAAVAPIVIGLVIPGGQPGAIGGANAIRTLTVAF